LIKLDAEMAELRLKKNPPEEGEILSTKEMRDAEDLLDQKERERRDLVDYLREAEYQTSAEEQREKAEHKVAKDKSKARAIDLYPDVADETTPLGRAVAKRFEEMRNPKHPNHPFLYGDSSPEWVTETVARELGIAPKTPPTAATPTPKAPPQAKAAPPSGAKTSVPEKPAEQLVGQKAMEYVRGPEVSLTELDAIQGGDKGLAAAIR
jgi:hypothetical protein